MLESYPNADIASVDVNTDNKRSEGLQPYERLRLIE